MGRFEVAFGQWVVNARWWFLAATGLAVLVAGSGMRFLTINNDTRVFFSEKNPQWQALEMLEEIQWIARIATAEENEEKEQTGYRPAKPLARYTLSRFKQAMNEIGQSDMAGSLGQTDPILSQYTDALKWHEKDELCRKRLDQLLGSESEAGANS